jgi:hypothetical protein
MPLTARATPPTIVLLSAVSADLDPAAFDDVDWGHVTHVVVVPFRQDDGRLVLIDTAGRLSVPRGDVVDGEDPYLDATLRIPLEQAGFRKQHLEVFAAAGDVVAVWCDGFRYDGGRAHADVDWWIGEAGDGAARLASQGDGELARLVSMADSARRSLSDDEFFASNLRHLERAYLDPRNTNPRQGSGFGGTDGEWFARRAHLRQAVDRDGTFLDVGCANGLLVESLVGWCSDDGHAIVPFGVDLSVGLVAEAGRRLPPWADHFFVGNALEWTADGGRRFDFVHALFELVLPARRAELVDHLCDEVAASGGRVILSHYVPVERTDQWPRAILESLGFTIGGETVPDDDPRPVAPSAWIDV